MGARLTVPLTFINFNENVTFKVFGTIGNQYVERFTNYGIGNNNYWDWQIGLGATVYGFDLTSPMSTPTSTSPTAATP